MSGSFSKFRGRPRRRIFIWNFWIIKATSARWRHPGSSLVINKITTKQSIHRRITMMALPWRPNGQSRKSKTEVQSVRFQWRHFIWHVTWLQSNWKSRSCHKIESDDLLNKTAKTWHYLETGTDFSCYKTLKILSKQPNFAAIHIMIESLKRKSGAVVR